MIENLPPELTQSIPGAIGSAVALRWFPGSWPAKLATWVSGTAVAVLCTMFVAWYFGLTAPLGLGTVAGFAGLFGVLVMDKIQELIKAAPIAQFWDALMLRLRRFLGIA